VTNKNNRTTSKLDKAEKLALGGGVRGENKGGCPGQAVSEGEDGGFLRENTTLKKKKGLGGGWGGGGGDGGVALRREGVLIMEKK